MIFFSNRIIKLFRVSPPTALCFRLVSMSNKRKYKATKSFAKEKKKTNPHPPTSDCNRFRNEISNMADVQIAKIQLTDID